MKDNLNLIEEIQRKQTELLMDFDRLKEHEIQNYDLLESLQRQQAEIADEFNHWLEQQQTESMAGGKENE